MSRSYKKTPYSGDKKSRDMKRFANKTVRQQLKNPEVEYPNKSYKKAFCSYDICDYYTIEGDFEAYYKRAVARWYQHQNYGWWRDEPFPTREEAYNNYMKYYKRK